jgi:hypothetical protein
MEFKIIWDDLDIKQITSISLKKVKYIEEFQVLHKCIKSSLL